jgi:hypothetical protein
MVTQTHAADEPAKDAKKSADAPAKEEQKPADESRIKTDAEGNTVVTVDDETQKRIGLKVESLAATELPPEIKGFGNVIDPTTLATALSNLATAEAAYNATSKELERLKTLKEQGNASDRALQAAEAAALRDQLLIQSAKDQLMLTWGKAVVEQKDLPGFVRSLTSVDSALVRLNLPAGEDIKSNPTGARVFRLSGRSVDAQFLAVAPGVDPLTQGQGYMFLIKPNQIGLRPGESVTGYIKIPGDPVKGVALPRDAVVRSEGRAWAYVQTGDTAFTRKEVPLDHPLENGWFVKEGFAPNDRVVVTGAQTLLSEERKASIKAD